MCLCSEAGSTSLMCLCSEAGSEALHSIREEYYIISIIIRIIITLQNKCTFVYAGEYNMLILDVHVTNIVKLNEAEIQCTFVYADEYNMLILDVHYYKILLLLSDSMVVCMLAEALVRVE